MTRLLLLLKASAHPAAPPPEPTQAQKEAGNYRMQHIQFQGMPISIENPRGSTRSGVDRKGKAWSVTMSHHYGYIKGTLGVDGDHFDVFVGPDPNATHVHVVNAQRSPDFKEFDEQKAMVGFTTADDAKRAFLENYSDPRFFGGMESMPVDVFRAKVATTRENPRKITAGGLRPIDERLERLQQRRSGMVIKRR